jgi:hypothetical protein
MNKSTFIRIVLLSMGVIACGQAASNNANRPANSAHKTAPSPAMNPDAIGNTMANSVNAMKSANSASTSARSNANLSSSTTQITQPASTPLVEKKDEGLFSFPPPRVISYSVIHNGDLMNKEGPTSFSQVSERLAAGLRKAGYDSEEKYAYFWNEKDEFAIVTAMERVNGEGNPAIGEGRWNTSTHLPSATDGSEYFRYLLSGKKTYYRVLAFVVTSRRTGNSFLRNSPPDFIMARNWKNKGEPNLGDGSVATIGEAFYTDRYKCFALLYLFVNHTRIDAPKSIDSLSENDESLAEGINRVVADHLRQTGITFGE